MRRVETEGDSQSNRRRGRVVARSSLALKPHLRRLALDRLEDRTLMSTSTSTLPSPIVLTPPNLASLSRVTAPQALTGAPSSNSPSVAVDPLNPLKMVAAWVDHDAAGYNPGGFVAPITSYIQGAYSTDGGVTWNQLDSRAFGTAGFGGGGGGFGSASVNVQEDFSLARPTNGTVNVFTQTTDATVGFDRNENVYILSSTHDAPAANGSSTAGVLDLQKFTFNTNTPVYTNAITRIYSWNQPSSTAGAGPADAAVTPTMAVDTNPVSYTDPATGLTQSDIYSGNIYVAWAEIDSNTFGGIPGFNPDTIRMATSSDQGAHFTHAAYVDNSSNANGHNSPPATNPPSIGPLHDSPSRYAAPQIAVGSMGAPGSGSQVTIVYDDFGIQAPLDQIVDQSNTLGGDSEQFSPDPSLVGPTSGTVGVDIPITVNIPLNSKFTTLQALDITASIAWPNLSGIGATLIPPASTGVGPINLFSGNIGISATGTPDSSPNLGATAIGTATAPTFGAGSGTVFDQEAVRRITDGNATNSATGHFQPTGEQALLALQGLSPAQLNGIWIFRTNIITADTSTNPKYVNNVILNFTSGNNPGSASGIAGSEHIIANKASGIEVNVPGINPTNPASSNGTLLNQQSLNNVTPTGVSGSGNITAPVQGTPILPAPVIASDNTLGSFSAHQGRLYVAFTGMFSNAQAGNTDIFLFYSDDNGKTWETQYGTNVGEQVNDDNAATDGYSGSVAGGTLGRTQYQPQIAVDQSTGNLVVSFLDARNDPSNARVATYVAVSPDGGNTFAADVYANPTRTALDAVTGNAVNLGPIPDNQSATGGLQDTAGYGTHQALIVTNGRIIPFWASNQNTNVAPNASGKLAIVDSIMSLASGPRIIASTQGPVGLPGDTTNTKRAADGTTLANTIEITFDRPIDPSSYAAIKNNTSVYYKSPSGGASISLPVTGITDANGNPILDANGNPLFPTGPGITQFKITFDPSGLASRVGTYSYVIRPTGIVDQIRQAVSGARGTVMDQNANGTSGQVPGDDYVVGQPTGFNTYAAGTLPLIVPGPHVSSIAAIDSTGAVISSGTNNLVLNNTVGALQVTFDRNILVSSLTPAQILSIFGPAGPVSLAGLTITPLQFFSGGGQAAYAGGATADVFKITFATQQLSGTYSMTLGTGILTAGGSAVDSNLNAGLDVLRGTATNGITTPVTYAATAPSAPSAIPAGTMATPGKLVSTINVPDNFPIQGDNGTVAGLTLSLDITYPNDSDLIAYLLAPDGLTRINLFTNVGAGTSTANFSKTTLSDTATTSIRNVGAPFFGTFEPEEPLANLATQAHLSSGGTWSLVIENGGASTGTLNSWSLTFQKPVSSTGLGEFPDDRSTVSFQIFNLAPSNALANSTWTAVGPAGITTSSNGQGTFAGAVSTMAVDPSDTTGNTVYVGSASGGIWKTTDFLTTSPAGPTYQPLTDFGPTFSLDIGSIAVFGRNSDPNQSVIFAGTGFGQSTTTSTAGYPNVDGGAGAGVGILKSTDGGVTWTLLDSLTNSDASGNPLPESGRDHTFVGTTTYKIVVDPTPQLNGQIIVYAALGGPKGGLYKSIDSGNTWKLLSGSIGGAATDILLDPNSKSPTTGNLDILYAAFPGHGVYMSSNQGQTLLPIPGQIGKTPLLVKGGIFPAPPVAVSTTPSPNGGNSSYIVLAKPALTNSVSENLDYQGWLYAAVENPDGTFQGLYVTKDAGENWTLVQLPNIPGTQAVKAAVPTNDTTGANSYDPTSSNFSKQGNYNLTLTVDPTNPNIVYLGGSGDFQESGLIRVDLTDLFDPQNFTSFSNDRTDGGQLFRGGEGGVNVAVPANGPATYLGQSQILNLRYAPNNGTPGTTPFNINATLVAYNVGTGFVNDGTGVTWSPFDEPLKANAGDGTGSTNLHSAIAYVDPITGDVRMIFADDEGVFTALVNPDGTLDNGIGTDVAANYSRNGNLQDEQFYYGAAQPSNAAAQAAQALFYASGQGTLAAQSGANVLSSGNLTWSNSGVLVPTQASRNTGANSVISTSDRSGVGIATDPAGAGTVFEYDVPILGGNVTDFFRVNANGQTTGLVANVNQEFPLDGTRASGTTGNDLAGAVANGQIPLGNFAVNPLNGQQILIGSATGNLYETTNQGIQWLPIGTPANFDGSQLSAIVYGAPDPNAPAGIGNLNNFVYVGTAGQVGGTQGHIYVTQAGGQGWTDISSGLDGSSVSGIYPDPNRGSHAAYAVTLNGVFYSSDTIGLAAAGKTVWTNITSNLASIQYNPFGNATYRQSVLAGFQSNSGTANQGTAQYGGFSSIVADYRYVIPAASNATGGTSIFYPVLYVSGYGGVFRSIDNGATWTVFPNTSFDSAPVDGGYLPSVDVTNLQIVLGSINPSTGHPTQTAGDAEVLLASTFGRGEFAIRLAPDVFSSTVGLDPTNPPPDGSSTGTINGRPKTNLVHPFISGTSEVSNFGNVVTIRLIDEANGKVIGTGTTDTFGHFSVQVGDLTNDPSFGLDGVKTVAVQATDSSGASGNTTLFTYILNPPPAPTGLTLDPSTNSGLNPAANITNNTHPLFDVTGVLPTDFLELFRSTGGSTPILVGMAAVGATQVRDTTGVPADGVYVYQAAQVDAAGDVSPLSPGLVVTINTQAPAAPTLALDPADDSGAPTHPNVTNVNAPRFIGTGTPGLGIVILSVTGNNFAGGVPITASVTVAADGSYLATVTNKLADGVYTLVARTINAAGNVSYSTPLAVTIKATGPQIVPTLSIFPADDTGIKGDGVTANRRPRFVGTTDKGVTVALYSLVNGQLTGPVAPAVSSSTIDGSFQLQIPSNLSDGNIQLVARATDVAGNVGPISPVLNVRIITVAGDYNNSGAAQFSVFVPTTETYYIAGGATFTSDTTPGRDVPVQYDINGDGKIDGVGYQFDSATYVGPLSNGGTANFQFGSGGTSLPVSGYFDSSGTFEYGLYNPNMAQWAILLPRPGGEVLNFGVPKVDIPVPAAYDGGGITEIATFRPSTVYGNDADSFNVVSPNFSSNYQVSFTDPTVPALKGFVYKPGDIPAPADYDGIGKDEFAIYRPTTGQFFILKVPNLFDKTTWTLRTVTLNLPGGPKVGDEPVSEDYEGTGKASPTVYRPSNSTFYEIQSTNGIQRNLQFGPANASVAAAGPLLYRLSALTGPYATTGGYNGGGVANAITPGSGPVSSAIATGPGVHADAIGSTSTATGGGSSQILPGSSSIALAVPTAVSAPAPAAPTPVPTASIPTVTAPTISLAFVPQTPIPWLTVGATTPKAAVKTHVATKPAAHPAHPAAVKKAAQPAKPAHKAAAPAKPLKVETTAHQPKSSPHPDQHHAAVAAALVHIAPIKKGRKND